MLNRIVIMGRLGHEPEVRYTQSGKPVATDWIDVVAWDAKAKFVQQYFHKGQQAVVEGRLQIRDYTGRDGTRRRAAEVVADNIYFAGAKAAAPSEGNAPEESLPPEPGESFSELEDEGELPF